MISVHVFIVVAIVGTVNSAQRSLPPFIEPCHRSDPDFNQCFIDHANKAIALLKDDNKKYKINGVDPLKINEAILQPGGNLKLSMKNIELYGLSEAKCTGADINLDKGIVKVKLEIPRCELIGDYEIDGRLVILPIQGSGKANMTSTDLVIDNVINYKEEEINGIKQVILKYDTLDLTTTRVYFYFGNLFNNEESVLAKEMQKFMDENWKDVHREFHPEFTVLLMKVLDNVFHQILHDVPESEVILP